MEMEAPFDGLLAKYKLPGGLYLELAFKYKVKQIKNG